MFDEILIAIIGLVSPTVGTVKIGSLPADGSISCYLGPGSPIDEDLKRNAKHDLFIVFNAKDPNQQQALAKLSTINRELTKQKAYPASAGWEILNISTSTTPDYVGQESNGQWLYSLTLRAMVKIKNGG